MIPDQPTGAATAPEHVEDAQQTILRLHAEHRDRATPLDRLFARATAAIARPAFLIGIAAAVLGWVGLNLLAPALGARAFDPAPFNLLQGLATVAALFATVLILTTQRRDDQIAARREQLALQLAILSDKRLAKLIALIEEQRRDHPELRNRIDPEAEAMAEPVDPRHVLGLMDRD